MFELFQKWLREIENDFKITVKTTILGGKKGEESNQKCEVIINIIKVSTQNSIEIFSIKPFYTDYNDKLFSPTDQLIISIMEAVHKWIINNIEKLLYEE